MNLKRLLLAPCFGLLVAVTSLSSAGCISSTSGASPEEEEAVAPLTVSPDAETLSVGTRVQFKATFQRAGSLPRDVTQDPATVWSASDPSIAEVSRTGLVTALKAGLVEISADYEGESGAQHFAIMP
jgi:uncharacterized protein YjdB